jgi:proton-coupled amino acid transporter
MAIAIGLTVIIIFASLELSDNGFTGPHEPINTVTFLSFIGLAAYTFEGIGIIIPVMEQCSRPDLYPHIIVGVISLVTTVYIFFGNYIYFIYGLDKVGEHPLVTDILPAKNIAVAIVDVIWIINLILTYPLVLYPATMVFESYVYAKVAKSPKRRWMKNLTRSMFVAFTVVLSVSLLDTLDKLESINGAFACIPLAFTLPALFHYKLRAETRTEKIIDLFIAALTFVLMIV